MLPPSSWKEGLDAKTLDGRVEMLTSKEDLKQASKVIGIAFAGTPTTEPEGMLNWVVGGKEPGKEPSEQSTVVMNWIADFCTGYCHKKGFVLGVKDENGKVIAAALVRSPNKHSFWPLRKLEDGMAFFAGLRNAPNFKPPWLEDAKMKKRMDFLDKIIDKRHNEVAPMPHYFLWQLGVSPATQGKGCGRALLTALNLISDRENIPIYLDASGERNSSIYKKFGYETKSHIETFCAPGLEDDPYCHKGGAHFMLRTPAPKN